MTLYCSMPLYPHKLFGHTEKKYAFFDLGYFVHLMLLKTLQLFQ